jgi:quercetin dioxygenase-like cupin family protein
MTRHSRTIFVSLSSADFPCVAVQGVNAMKLFRFGADVGRSLTAFGSHDVFLSRILRTTGGVQIGYFYVQPGGLIALHQAVGPQLFLVVKGEGWVRGKEKSRTPIHAGQALYWTQGEWGNGK